MINEFRPMNHLTSLQNLICTIGNLPTSYALSLSYEEQIWWLCDFLEKKVFPAIEENTNITEETQQALIELQNYVRDYFNNLDVQEEINNKLDEMVLDGTLENIIGKYITSNTKFIFPKFWENAESCEFNLIKHNNKNILIDTTMLTYWNNAKKMLEDNNINFIDCLIITHYDSDHVGNFKNLIDDGYINQNTKLFMPAEVSTHTDTIEYYKNLCNTNNLNYYVPYENEIFEIDGSMSLKFFNCDKDKLNALYTDYNDTSTVVLINHKSNKLLFTGDIGKKAQKRVYDEFINEKVDFYKIAHHGINRQDSSFPDLIKKIRPNIAVQTAGINLAKKGKFLTSSDITTLKEVNASIYPCYMQKDYIIITSNGFSLKVDSGKSYNYSMCPDDINLYVDINASTTQIQDGTQQHPFSELRQAIAVAENMSNININIYLSNGNYGYNTPPYDDQWNRHLFANKNNHITIHGNNEDRTKVKLNGCWFRNASVTFNNLTIDATYFNAIQSVNSNITLSNVLITADNQENQHTAINGTNSIVYCYQSRVENVLNGVAVYNNSIVTLTIFEFGYVSNSYFANNHNILINTYKVTCDNEEDNRNFKNRFTNYPQPICVFKNEDNTDFNTTEFNLNIDLASIKWIEVIYRTETNYVKSTGKVYNPTNKSLGLDVISSNANSITHYSAKLIPDNANKKYTLSNQIRMYFDRTNNNNLTVNESNYFHISQINVGLYDDTHTF